jgi:hypothetical protein
MNWNHIRSASGLSHTVGWQGRTLSVPYGRGNPVKHRRDNKDELQPSVDKQQYTGRGRERAPIVVSVKKIVGGGGGTTWGVYFIGKGGGGAQVGFGCLCVWGGGGGCTNGGEFFVPPPVFVWNFARIGLPDTRPWAATWNPTTIATPNN